MFIRSSPSLENFIPFEKFKRLNKRKYFVIPTASHKLHIFVTYKRLIWIQFDPFAHYNIINEVAHNSYNKIFPFGTPFAFLKRNKNFQWSTHVYSLKLHIKAFVPLISVLSQWSLSTFHLCYSSCLLLLCLRHSICAPATIPGSFDLCIACRYVFLSSYNHIRLLMHRSQRCYCWLR